MQTFRTFGFCSSLLKALYIQLCDKRALLRLKTVMKGIDMDTTVKAALVSGIIAAGSLLINNYLQADVTKTVARQKAEFDFLQFTSGPTSQIAYCNLKLWKEAGLFASFNIDNAIEHLKTERGTTDNCKI